MQVFNYCNNYKFAQQFILTRTTYKFWSFYLCQVSIPVHGNSGKKRATTAIEDAKSWMKKHFLLVGDCIPNTNRVHLPSWDSQKFVFEIYREDILSQGSQESDIVGLRTFYRIWKE